MKLNMYPLSSKDSLHERNLRGKENDISLSLSLIITIEASGNPKDDYDFTRGCFHYYLVMVNMVALTEVNDMFLCFYI